MLSPAIVADTGLGSTGTAIVSSYGGIAPSAGPPAISSVDPAPIPAGALWTALTVRGANFAPGTAVESPELDVQDTTVHSDSWITAHVRAKGGTYSGPGDLWVTAPGGVQSPAVSILILGASGPAAGPAQPVTIYEPVPQPVAIPGETTTAPPAPTPPDVLNVDRQATGGAGAAGGGSSSSSSSSAPAPELKVTAAAGQGAAGAGAATAGSSSSSSGFPWWLLVLVFILGKAT